MISPMLVPGPGRGGPATSFLLRVARKLAPSWVSRKESQAYEAAGAEYAGKIRADPAAVGREAVDENPLFAQFDAYREGPGIWKPRQYFKVYHRHLGRFIGRAVNVVEIGVYSGGSLRMWRDYFGESAVIHGVDIEEECRRFEADRIKVAIGDQSDRRFWQKFVDRVAQIDIVIDDGSHVPEHQVATFEAVLPHIANGGVYICEDIGGVDNPFHSYLAGLARNLSPLDPQQSSESQKTTGLQQSIEGIHLYPYIAVIEKPERPFGEFSTEVRGTDWIDDQTAHLTQTTPNPPASSVNGPSDS